ncbi:hypothetical protein [Micromonospora sp. URMC 103]|uniref:hypothetical protein n=1 Tax=Micromonospora sp. URMC 103 TaxID=3423406 RepID=UPI003F1D90A4
MPSYRCDLYAAGARFRRTERFIARHEVEAVETARGLVVAHGVDYAVVYVADGAGHVEHIAMVGAER